MVSFKKKIFGSIRRYPILGGRRLSNYLWSLVIFFGGYGFLVTGISSYYNKNFFLIIPGIKNFVLPSEEPIFMALTFLNKNIDKFTKINQFVHERSIDLVDKQSSYHKIVNDTTNIGNNLPFFPQGLVLSFYGFLGLCFSFHLWFTLFWKIGGGFNEFNEKEKYVRIFRWGRPGKNRRIDLKYTNELIETIKVEFVPRPALFLRVKGDKKIPLTRIGEFIPLEELEAQAAELTRLLQIPLEIEN